MDLRVATRHPVDLDADCRAADRAWGARLRNISTGGCMIESPDPGLAIGSVLRLRLRGMPAIDGAIAWQHRGHAGVRFREPLSAATLERLGVRAGEPAHRAPAALHARTGLRVSLG